MKFDYTPEQVEQGFGPMFNEFFLGGIFAHLKHSPVAMLIIEKTGINPWLALQVGTSLLFDKPLLIITDEGVKIPARLAQLADGVFYVKEGDPDSMHRARNEMLKKIADMQTEGRIPK